MDDNPVRVLRTLVSRARRTLSETGNARRTDFRFTRRVTRCETRDDLHGGRFATRYL